MPSTGQAAPPDYGDSVELPDGRTLAYAEYGDPEGAPVFFFHGTPGSRVSGSVARDEQADVGARVVAPDRPGMGRSDYQSERSLSDWPADVAALADELGFAEYGVVGFSGGGPYALACAALTPERVTRCAVVSGVGPRGVGTEEMGHFERAVSATTRRSPHLGRPLTWLLGKAVADADRFTDVVGDPKDGDLADPRLGETGRIMLSDFREGVRQGSLALATDFGVVHGDWEFDLGDVAVPTRAYHGSEDQQVSPTAGEHVAREVPDAEFVVVDGACHFRPIIEHVNDIYGWVVDGEPAAATAESAEPGEAAERTDREERAAVVDD